MAVNPKLILIASELAGNEKVRKTLLYVLFFSLGLIMLIFVVFIGLISGLLSIAQDNDLRNHWNYYRTSISEIFSSIEGEINSDVKSEVYDFMPEFSVNLSKATIANNFDNSSLILYDEKEIRQAQEIMQDYAEKLRKITTEEAFDSFISGYETELSFSDIRNIRFTDDAGIDGISAYPDAVKLFLYNRAMERMPAYSYSFEEITVDDKSADRQTLVVTSPDGSTQTVEYTCIGGGEVYLPEFLAMYNIRQSREYLTSVTQNQAPDIETQIEQALGGIPETAEEAQDYLNGAWQGIEILDIERVQHVRHAADVVSMRVGSYNIIQRTITLTIYVGNNAVAVFAFASVNEHGFFVRKLDKTAVALSHVKEMYFEFLMF